LAGSKDFLDASIIKDVPIWAFHGDQDKVCPIERDQRVFSEMQSIGGNMKFTAWTGDGHGVAAKMITGSDNGITQLSSDRCDPEPVFLDWLFKQRTANHERSYKEKARFGD
jgi:predicted peptidase